MEGAGEGRGGDLRIPLIAAGFILLGTVVAVVLLAGGSSARKASAAPAGCISLWNEDDRARLVGFHNYHGHDYREAEVTYVDRAGAPAAGGRCAVIFPSASLDREQFAAARVYRRGRWVSLGKDSGMRPARLAELQAEALGAANTALRADGTLAPL